MSLKVVCPAGHLLQVAPRLAGRTLPCPRCGLPVAVPTVASAAGPVVPAVSTSPSADIPFEPIVDTVSAREVVEPFAKSRPTAPTARSESVRTSSEERLVEPSARPAPIEAAAPSIAAAPLVAAASLERGVPSAGGALSPSRAGLAPAAPPPLDPPARLPPPLPPPPPRLGYECPAEERSRLGVVLAALGAVAFVLMAPAVMEIADHLTATASAGVGRWAYALLALAVVQVAYAAWLWQAPDWSGLAAVSIVELVQAMLLAFVLGLLLAARPDHGWLRWMELSERAGGDLPRLWCLVAVGLIGGLAVWSGRLAVAWRRRASSSV